MSFSVNVFALFRDYLPLEKDGALHLNKLEDEYVKFYDNEMTTTNFDQKIWLR